MDNGFYATIIADSKAHAGVTVVEDNKVRGGDAQLSLMGSKTETGFRLTGYSPSGREIVIDARKIANIDLGF